jgi:site-specific recombinase
LPEATSLPRELIARLKRRILPQLEDDLDLYGAIHMMHPDAADADWIAGLDDADRDAWRELLGSSTGHILAALRLLAVRAAAIAVSRNVMRVMPHRCEAESPFLN